MRVGIDIMGGDFAPLETVKGAIQAYQNLDADCRLVLIGDSAAIVDICKQEGFDPKCFEIVDAPEVITMSDHPAKAFMAKRNSSIHIGFQMLGAGDIDVFASAGSTGAMMVGASLVLKPIEGILRPGIAVEVPCFEGTKNVLMDVGLNSDCKPEHLNQYGLLGSLYAQYVLGIENPKVGLLNIGKESEKGNVLTKATYPLMNENKTYNFIGNVEGNQIYHNDANVIVCDGFVGNALLKASENFYSILKECGFTTEFFNGFNPDTYGGTPVLGIDKNVIIGHGASNSLAIKNMILQSVKVVRADLPGKIKQNIQKGSDE